jgi:hypothetical protein
LSNIKLLYLLLFVHIWWNEGLYSLQFITNFQKFVLINPYYQYRFSCFLFSLFSSILRTIDHKLILNGRVQSNWLKSYEFLLMMIIAYVETHRNGMEFRCRTRSVYCDMVWFDSIINFKNNHIHMMNPYFDNKICMWIFLNLLFNFIWIGEWMRELTLIYICRNYCLFIFSWFPTADFRRNLQQVCIHLF